MGQKLKNNEPRPKFTLSYLKKTCILLRDSLDIANKSKVIITF